MFCRSLFDFFLLAIVLFVFFLFAIVLFVFFLFDIVLFVLRFIASEYLFDIFKLYL